MQEKDTYLMIKEGNPGYIDKYWSHVSAEGKQLLALLFKVNNTFIFMVISCPFISLELYLFIHIFFFLGESRREANHRRSPCTRVAWV